ncbi:uncharacterized protein EV420DRAFT_1480657 [Desarmillaria tabescens]|uniref:Uncharacterized protein n=1 Tax=Armillaria tabescens TaxID=1929756 RepID=A0AA39KAI4_ARMTA|nr:uncharacterized protein EV420DRAFT_1480657 [Desarmillaria tabescens]KAK0457597.1 hypothetical protein EV420DRAFT_1480657 [Desarmillaria tabescens]
MEALEACLLEGNIHMSDQCAQHLAEFVIVPAPPPRDFVKPTVYTHISHAPLQRLSFVVTVENTHRITKIPVSFDYVTLPALERFGILVDDDYNIGPGSFEAIEYSRLTDLLCRSRWNLISITLSIPVPVEAFLVPILAQSPAIQKLDIFINTSLVKDILRALTFEQGVA